MSTTPSQTPADCPKFLKQSLNNQFKDQIEKAYAMHLRDSGKTRAEENVKKPKMRALLPHLQEIDSIWMGI